MKRRRILIIPVLLVLLNSPAVYADKDDTTTEINTETTTENTTEGTEASAEATTETAKVNVDDGKWVETKKGWRFQDSAGNMAKNETITIKGKEYSFDENGYWIEDAKEPTTEEKKHGENYNASSEVYIIQGNAPVERVEKAIAALNDKSEEKDIRNVRYMYNSLTMAQKARVKNESVLYEKEKEKEIAYDYSTLYQEDQDGYVISGNSVKGTSYTYDLDEKTPCLSISVQYTVDADMDGVKDVPVITLKKPDGTSIGIATDTAEIRDASMNIKMTWADKFMQFDIASGEYGKWMLMTDEPVVFTSMEYAGSMQEIVAIPETNDEHSTEGKYKEDKNDEEDKKSSGMNSILKIVILLVAGAVIFILLKPKKDQKTKIQKNKAPEELENPIPPEEDIEKIRAELKKQLNVEDYNDYPDNKDTEKNAPEFQPMPLPEQVKSYSEDSGILYRDEDDFLNDFL